MNILKAFLSSRIRKFTVLALLLTSGAAVFNARLSAADHHWGYSGSQGPGHWGELDPAFSACSAGKSQSPINVTGAVPAHLPAMTFSYGVGGNEIVNNGHTIQVNFPPGNTLTVNGHIFELKQFHVHVPSENQIQGKSYPMEAHFVHADAQGRLAVVALFFEPGTSNVELAKAWSEMPPKAGEKRILPVPVSAQLLLPSNHDYYRYSGSLTTPPCSEGVIWLVLKAPVRAAKEQMDQVLKTLHHPNSRPIQPLNARTIEE